MKKKLILTVLIITAAITLTPFAVAVGEDMSSEQTVPVLESGPHLESDPDHQPDGAAIIGVVLLIGALLCLERYLVKRQ
ncbi:MAG: hypothetical protein J6W53_04515 [Candidatus Methanomethylophilaceae archaeon]|nr:hypothetical protein [Candidatus Methanomethylophilaceae archaeon]